MKNLGGRVAVLILGLLVFGLMASCGDPQAPSNEMEPSDENSTDAGFVTGTFTSDPGPPIASPRPAAFAGGAVEVAYMSAAPGTYAQGESVEIVNGRTSERVSAAIVNGGFDPVAIQAQVGDTLTVEITNTFGQALETTMLVVPDRARPVIVRSRPPDEKVSVPLNQIMQVVFSEPMAAPTITIENIHLTDASGAGVAASIRLRDDGLVAYLTPNELLETSTRYSLTITTNVTDASGDAFETEVVVRFTTESVGGGVFNTFVVSGDSQAQWPGGELILDIVVGLADAAGSQLAIPDLVVQWTLHENGSARAIVDATDGRGRARLRWTLAALEGVQSLDVQIGNSQPARVLANAVNGGEIAFRRVFLVYDETGNPVDWGGSLGLHLMSATGTNLIPFSRLLRTRTCNSQILATEDVGVSWFPDGQSLIVRREFCPTNNLAFVSMRADGSGTTGPELISRDEARRLSISPDGQLIAYWNTPSACTRASGMQLYIMRADGTNRQAITSNCQTEYRDVSWSPDGTRLAFAKGPERPSSGELIKVTVGIINVDGSNEIILTDGTRPQWSPDGRSILFSRYDDFFIPTVHAELQDTLGVFLFDLESGVETRVWDPDGWEQTESTTRPGTFYISNLPTISNWSPDGSRFIVSRWGGDFLITWIVDLAAGTANQLEYGAFGGDRTFGQDFLWRPRR